MRVDMKALARYLLLADVGGRKGTRAGMKGGKGLGGGEEGGGGWKVRPLGISSSILALRILMALRGGKFF